MGKKRAVPSEKLHSTPLNPWKQASKIPYWGDFEVEAIYSKRESDLFRKLSILCKISVTWALISADKTVANDKP